MEKGMLVQRAKAGDEAAFEELLILHTEQLYRTAYLYVGNREDALDVVQETSYKAYVGLKKLKEVEYFSTWLIRILIRTSYECIRKKKKISFVEEENVQVLNEADRNLSNSELLKVVQQLRKKYRDVILLHYFQELTVKEVSQVLVIPEGTVKTYLFRGRKQLKKILKAEGYDE
ncbi:MAG TPA: sigma-70 family RNA polymerase sigma factor [Candidatus Enterococcus avicola]|uniref:Sigma-70 family RNA polymerase sigma factor n=1 Tax=Candidatus Enterococcus avicola TaxID=2838561 RepID=A0A9D2F9N7_9ENTE|nr:sigma-70 family RNA polymerase sigma factor [Candidatus Enterococcus avicola]